METKKFLILLQETLELKDKKITIETNIQDLDEWDSMTALLLISLVSSEFDVELDADDLLDLTSIQSLIERIGIEKFQL